VHRIEVILTSGQPDRAGLRLARRAAMQCDMTLAEARTSRVYLLEGDGLDREAARWIGESLLSDPVVEEVRIDEPPAFPADFIVEVAPRPGVTDNEGATAAETVAFAREAGRLASGPIAVQTARRVYLRGPGLAVGACEHMARELLMNPLVQRAVVVPGHAPEGLADRLTPPRVTPPSEAFRRVDLPEDDEGLARASREGLWSLTVAEMRAVRAHFADQAVRRARLDRGLPAEPTDVELEAIAQTWSEHCKHKIFNDTIVYTADGQTETIPGLFKTFIRGSTEVVATRRDWLVSVFTDNAGVIRWNDTHHLVFKAETHNAPSALEPYGGALTGIVGVNRDPAGTGRGARLLFNTDVFCFAPPTWSRPLPPGVLHPRRLFDGVRQGVEDGGNQSGIPTVNGGLFFDDRFLGRPLVFCGTGGLMQAETQGTPTHLKDIRPGDLVVMAGGRVGKDGIHGATFSSEATGADNPVGVVQIGAPIVQKMLLDMLAEARERGLYRTLTDNGAGGLSSSVGELAELSGGATLELSDVPLKYPGLAPWEILVSESQERMTLAVDPAHWDELAALAEHRGVEVAVVGRFTDDGTFSATWHGEPVMRLELDFLHGGLPRRTLEAEWTPPATDTPRPASPMSVEAALPALLGSLNICSRESVIRQYDHEVQGGSVVKPLVGIAHDGPSDAAVIRPLLDSDLGVAVSCAINPHHGDHDARAMAHLAVDEAIRNAVAVGADPDHLALLDNFCWPDPVFDPAKNPDGKFKLAQLVRACQGLYEATTAFDAPLVSGKDSVKNDYHGPDGKLSIPPTLLVSAIARVPDIRRAVTMDLKAAGNVLVVLGTTAEELGTSQWARLHGWTGGQVPRVDLEAARARYRALHGAIRDDLVRACHDASEGGLAVALAEMAFAGGLGATVQLEAVPTATTGDTATADSTGALSLEALLFGESASRLLVEVAPQDLRTLETRFEGLAIARIGVVTDSPDLVLRGRPGEPDRTWKLDALKKAWQGGLSA
jgi:phosphoribosylformylglycinamidine synthase